jgi:hypothetical protein
MTSQEQQHVYQDPSPVLDTFDVDLVMKVLSNTLFSPYRLPDAPYELEENCLY